MRSAALWAALTLAGLIVAFGVGFGVNVVVNAMLPPFRFEDGDTMREFGPVALGYGSTAVTAFAGAWLAWRFVTRSR